MSDAAIKAKTGCTWERWVWALDRSRPHLVPPRDRPVRAREVQGPRLVDPDGHGGLRADQGPSSDRPAAGRRISRPARARSLESRGPRSTGPSMTRAPRPLAARRRPQIRTATREKSMRITWPDQTLVELNFMPREPEEPGGDPALEIAGQGRGIEYEGVLGHQARRATRRAERGATDSIKAGLMHLLWWILGTIVLLYLVQSIYLGVVLKWEDEQTGGLGYYGLPPAEREGFKRRLRLHAVLLAPILWLNGRLAKMDFRRAGMSYKGVAGPAGSCTPETFARAEQYRPGPEDIFVVTQMKCGTTWMQHVVYEVLNRGNGNLVASGTRSTRFLPGSRGAAAFRSTRHRSSAPSGRPESSRPISPLSSVPRRRRPATSTSRGIRSPVTRAVWTSWRPMWAGWRRPPRRSRSGIARRSSCGGHLDRPRPGLVGPPPERR